MTTGKYRVLGVAAPIWVSYASFVGLGLYAGLLGVAIPSLIRTYGISPGAIGWMFLSQTTGHVLLSFLTGRVVAALGFNRLFVIATAAFAVMALLIGFSPFWLLMVAMGFVLGLGNGALDSGVNMYVAANGSAREMNFVHACFGIGLVIGPLIMTAAISSQTAWETGFAAALSFGSGVNVPAQATTGWRWGYIIVGTILFSLPLLFWLTRSEWSSARADTQEEQTNGRATLGESLQNPLVWVSMILFVLYAGLEIGVGQWVFTLFTQSRNVPEVAAGQWVSIYWASFTVGRVFFGIIADRLPTTPTLRLAFLGSALGVGLLSWNPVNAVGFAGLTLFGFAQAPLFPLLILDTAGRLGARHASNAIGFQVGASGVGFVVIPGIAGILADNIGVAAMAPFFFVAVVLLVGLHELTLALRPKHQVFRQTAPTGD